MAKNIALDLDLDLAFLDETVSEGPSEKGAEKTGAIRDLVKMYLDKKAKVAFMEEELKKANGIVKELEESTIPTALENCGIQSVEILIDGNVYKLTVACELYVRIKETDRAAAFAFLRTHGCDSIKTQIIVNPTDSRTIDKSVRIKRMLAELDVNYSERNEIHHKTLTATMKRLLGFTPGSTGVVMLSNVPKNAFNIHNVNKAKIRGV